MSSLIARLRGGYFPTWQSSKFFDFFALLAMTMVLCSCNQENWTAFVYPDITRIPPATEVQNYIIGKYSNFNECQKAAYERMDYLHKSTGILADYECGYQCSFPKGYDGLMICKMDRR